MKLTRTQLTAAQSARKAELETIIKAGLQSFVAVGNALTEVKEEKLYLDEFDSFEDYMRQKWGYTRQRGYQLIAASEVAQKVSTVVTLETERAARPLTQLKPREQVRVAKVLARSPEPVTARRVEQAVETVRARGGLAATIRETKPVESETNGAAHATNDRSDATEVTDGETAARRVERWWAQERTRLCEYPMATPSRVVDLILRVLRG